MRGLRSVNFSEGGLMAAGMEILALLGGEDVNPPYGRQAAVALIVPEAAGKDMASGASLPAIPGPAAHLISLIRGGVEAAGDSETPVNAIGILEYCSDSRLCTEN